MLNTTNTDITAADLARLEALLTANLVAMRQAVIRVFKGSHRYGVTEDCVQTAAMKIWASPEKFLAARNFKALATTVARNTAIDWARLADNGGGRFSHNPYHAQDANTDAEDTDADAGDNSEVVQIAAEDGRAHAERFAELDALHKAIDAVLAADERLFVLALLDGADNKDAAQAAGWSASKASRNRDGIMARLAAYMA